MAEGALIYKPRLVSIARTPARSGQAGTAGTQAATFAGAGAAAAPDAIVLDVSLRESHSMRSTVTRYPVEKGANITDHALIEPMEISFDGLISNTPLSREQQTRIIQTQAGDVITTALDEQPAGAIGYAEEALAKIIELWQTATMVTLVTALVRYENMLITSLTVPRDGNSGDAVMFTCVMQEIRIVENKVTVVKVRAIPAQKKANLGKQPAAPATPATRQSALDWLGQATGANAALWI